jgi:exonuclease VII large subunit
MVKIKFVSLVKGSCLFHYVYSNDTSYDDILSKTFWSNLSQITISETREILRFLNKWKCRLSNNCAQNLQQSLQQISPQMQSFQTQRLENIILNSQNIQQITTIYNNLNNVIKPTATSKVMHLINVNLFPMWDQYICEGYGIKSNCRTAQNYINFMQQLQKILNNIVNKIIRQRNVNQQQAIQIIKNSTFQGKYSLVKILDEYNYMKFTYSLLGL